MTVTISDPSKDLFYTAADSPSALDDYEEKSLCALPKTAINEQEEKEEEEIETNERKQLAKEEKDIPNNVPHWKLGLPGSIKTACLVDEKSAPEPLEKSSSRSSRVPKPKRTSKLIGKTKKKKKSLLKDNPKEPHVLESSNSIGGSPQFTASDFNSEEINSGSSTGPGSAKVLDSLSIPSSPLSVYSPFSPVPVISFSPVVNSEFLASIQTRRLLEELIESEDTFVVSLNLLSGFYLDPLKRMKNDLGVPFLLLNQHLEDLKNIHRGVHRSMTDIIESKDSVEKKALAMAKLLGDSGIDVQIYASYCSIYEGVFRLIRENSLFSTRSVNLDQRWTSAMSSYLEVTQPRSKHMDLSFNSLIQRPVARIAKYRLIVEALSKLVSVDARPLVQQSLEHIKAKLTKVNQSSISPSTTDPGEHLEKFLELKGVQYKFAVSVPFFGNLLLCGCTTAIWVEESCKNMTCGMLLFKSHLTLVVPKKASWISGKHVPIFIIPLAKCSIVKSSADFDGGLYSDHLWSMKLIFENKYCHYELLLAFVNEVEFDVWYHYLAMAINIVHGPCRMDFEDDFEYLAKYPKPIIPYDVALNCSTRIKSRCYFKEAKPVTIRLNWKEAEFATRSRYFAAIQNGNRVDEIVLKRSSRLAVETALQKIWSTELPLVSSESKEAVKRSSSWSTLRMNSFRGLRHSLSTQEFFRADYITSSNSGKGADSSVGGSSVSLESNSTKDA